MTDADASLPTDATSATDVGNERNTDRRAWSRRREQWLGHFWTLQPYLARKVRPAPPPPSRHVRTQVQDDVRGTVRLTGRLSQVGDEPSETLVLTVHGLGGSHESHSVVDVARAAAKMGLDCLRMNMRGADRTGNDYYHAGLTADIVAMLASEAVAPYRRILLLGISMGGHLSLRLAAGQAERFDSRVAAVAAICPPIDLAAGVAQIDQPKGRLYRSAVLDGLKETYRVVARQQPVPAPVEEAESIDTIRGWDTLVVAPRHGFASAEDYWAKTTVAPHLGKIQVPTLVVSTEHDPMVFADTVWPILSEYTNIETVLLSRGGHCGFPPRLSLGYGDAGDVTSQTLTWLRTRALPVS